MSLALTLALSLLIGAALGWAYFRLLWAAVERLPRQQSPGSRMVLALLARLALAFAVFALVAKFGGAPALMAALAGFVLARTVLVRRARAPTPRPETPP